jgi:hypothetical protein
MKRICLLACIGATAFSLASPSSAATTGPYIGIGAGQDQVKTPDKYAFNVNSTPGGSTTRTLNGVGYRAFAGVNLSKFVGFEAGYTKYARSLYVGRLPGVYDSFTFYFHTYDAVVKGYLPLGDSGFNIYGLLGAARVVETLKYTNNGIPLSGSIAPPNANSTHAYRNRPLYGLGFNYNFGHHYTINLEATQIDHFGGFNNNANSIPYLDLYSLNFAYNFC